MSDVVILIDSSISIQRENFYKLLGFAKSIVNTFNMEGSEGTRVGVATFESTPTLRFHLNRYTKKTDVLNAISFEYTSGSTMTHLALKFARETMFTTANGARANAQKVTLLDIFGALAPFQIDRIEMALYSG